MLPKHIKISNDLVTKHEDIRKGFLNQAIIKGKISDEFVERAKEFRVALENVDKVEDVLSLSDFQEELMAAAGFSQKAQSHLSSKEIKSSIKKVFNKILERDNCSFQDEIVYHYLLTKGDSLGGSIRNIVGSLASKEIAAVLLKVLRGKGIQVRIIKNKSGKIQHIIWKNRFLIFDHKPKLIGKNIDVILVDTSGSKKIDKEIFNEPDKYLACGELKGGIDPAGADEHWKTANSALGRIRTCFAEEKNKPKLFFIGSAIESSMAKEIFDQLQNDKLSYAANFNNKSQVTDFVNWLIGL